MSDPHPSLIKARASEITTHCTRNGDKIVFRPTHSPFASLGYPGEMWAVEYWRPGLAFAIADTEVFVSSEITYLCLLFVREGYRRQGIGTALFTAIRQRWPNVAYDPVSEEGEAFLSRFTDRQPCGKPASER